MASTTDSGYPCSNTGSLVPMAIAVAPRGAVTVRAICARSCPVAPTLDVGDWSGHGHWRCSCSCRRQQRRHCHHHIAATKCLQCCCHCYHHHRCLSELSRGQQRSQQGRPATSCSRTARGRHPARRGCPSGTGSHASARKHPRAESRAWAARARVAAAGCGSSSSSRRRSSRCDGANSTYRSFTWLSGDGRSGCSCCSRPCCDC